MQQKAFNRVSTVSTVWRINRANATIKRQLDVMLRSKEAKFLQVSKLGAGFC